MFKTERRTMTEEERLEAIQQLLERLEELSRTHVLLAEGKKDREALDALGIGGDIFQVQSGGGPVAAADYVRSRGGKAVILTDWDRRGNTLADDLKQLLEGNSSSVDTQIRRELSGLCRMYIKDVESLDSLVALLSGKVYER